MAPIRIPRRPAAQALVKLFRARVGQELPPESKIYRNDTSQPVTAVPEYAPMGGVVLAYPGADPNSATGTRHGAPDGVRTFGVPDELIVRMQQNDSAQPVHIFVFCEDPAAKRQNRRRS